MSYLHICVCVCVCVRVLHTHNLIHICTSKVGSTQYWGYLRGRNGDLANIGAVEQAEILHTVDGGCARCRP